MVSSDASLLRRRDDKKLTAVPQTLEQSLLNPSSRATAMSERMEEGSAVRDSSEGKKRGRRGRKTKTHPSSRACLSPRSRKPSQPSPTQESSPEELHGQGGREGKIW